VLAGVWSVSVPFPKARAADVYVVDTVQREETRLLGQSLEAACPSCGTVKYRQMNGNMRAATTIADELRVEERAGRLALVVTLGKPATKVIADRLENAPVFYTFVGAPMPAYRNSDRVRGFPTDAPVDVQMGLLRELLPSLETAGIVLSRSNVMSADYRRLGNSASLNLYWIEDRKEMPDALRRAVSQNDALIFLRDSMVINKDTIRFLLQFTLENGRHTLGYSKPLVDMGFAAALVPRAEAFGRLVGQAAERHLTGAEDADMVADRSFYDVHLNNKVISQLARRTKPVQHTGRR
jgi:ABC-type uncharacterized transport system substrate-binding protein